jgi:hypothetical protein
MGALYDLSITEAMTMAVVAQLLAVVPLTIAVRKLHQVRRE